MDAQDAAFASSMEAEATVRELDKLSFGNRWWHNDFLATELSSSTKQMICAAGILGVERDENGAIPIGDIIEEIVKRLNEKGE